MPSQQSRAAIATPTGLDRNADSATKNLPRSTLGQHADSAKRSAQGIVDLRENVCDYNLWHGKALSICEERRAHPLKIAHLSADTYIHAITDFHTHTPKLCAGIAKRIHDVTELE